MIVGMKRKGYMRMVGYLAVSSVFLLFCGCGPDPRDVAFLANWSRDGSCAALVPNWVSDEKVRSGVWVYDSRTGKIDQIVDLGENVVCSHPTWSPSGNEILFAVLDRPEDDSSGDDDERVSYSVYIVDRDGGNLRKPAEEITTNSGLSAFLAENAVTWGPLPDTIIFQESMDDKVTAVRLDLRTGAREQFLPRAADTYVLAPSPDRRKVAALLYDEGSGFTGLYVADFALMNWRLVEILKIDHERFELFDSIPSWSPDSSRFAFPEQAEYEDGSLQGQEFISIYDVATGGLHLACSGSPTSILLWNREGSALAFSESVPEGDRRIVLMDLKGGKPEVIVTGKEYFLLSWNHEDNRLYFFRAEDENQKTPEGGKIVANRLYSCAPDGTNAQSLGRLLTHEDPLWRLSSDGVRLMVFSSPAEGGIFNLTSGELVRLSMEKE